MHRPRLSADSKLLVAGGALAAAMLLVAVGVLVGQRSSSSTAPAAATVQSPVVEAKAPTAAAVPTAATANEVRPSVPDRPLPTVAKSESPTSIDVQQLPSATRSHAQGWSVATSAPKAAASAGWVAAPPVRSTATAAADTAAEEPSTGDSPSTATATVAAAAQEAPAPSASAAPPVDPFVQAVREDIREDEARTK
jgi:S-DNA-T family DNA segregation ATPase FtsK/SpoIIIE